MDSILHGTPDSLRIKQVEEQFSALRSSVICAFNQLLDLKDLNTGVHSTRLAEWGMRVGQELGLVSRIVSVTDAFDAMVSSRPYRKGLPLEEAIRRLILASGTQFDPVVVQCFLSFAQAEMATVFAAAGTSVSSAL